MNSRSKRILAAALGVDACSNLNLVKKNKPNFENSKESRINLEIDAFLNKEVESENPELQVLNESISDQELLNLADNVMKRILDENAADTGKGMTETQDNETAFNNEKSESTIYLINDTQQTEHENRTLRDLNIQEDSEENTSFSDYETGENEHDELESIGDEQEHNKDDESGHSGEEQENDEVLVIENNVSNVRKRSRKALPERWQQNHNKYRRERGMPYQSRKKIGNQWHYKIDKPGKFLDKPCNCGLSRKVRCIIQCQQLTQECRLHIFQRFWNKLRWNERKIEIQNLVKREAVKRRRGTAPISHRNYSYKYFLAIGLQNIRVCQKMFCGTLGLKKRTVLSWIDEWKSVESVTGPKSNNKSNVRTERFRLKKEAAYEFLQSLPKMESHYCRSSSSKLYLEPHWRSMNKVYTVYSTIFCPQKGIEAICIERFQDIFKDLKLSVYHPKKDRCDICVGYEEKNVNEEEYNLHLVLKEEARAEKSSDKETSSDTTAVYCMDLQCVLLCPKSNVSANYYKTKLIVHNFTLYNLKTNEGFCFLWDESEGGLTSNEFSSIITYFIEQQLGTKPEITEMIFYSDGCTGQNRNCTLANAFVNLAQIYKKVSFKQKYLFRGHTQMEVDSMHSTIEKAIRHQNIYLPSQYAEHCENARKSPFPYKVKQLQHDFFKNFEDIKFYTSIRPGRSKGEPVVTDIKALHYLNNGTIEYKLRHRECWKILPKRISKLAKMYRFDELPRLYSERRKIKSEKYNHLQQLKPTLHVDYHKWYDDIPHE